MFFSSAYSDLADKAIKNGGHRARSVLFPNIWITTKFFRIFLNLLKFLQPSPKMYTSPVETPVRLDILVLAFLAALIVEIPFENHSKALIPRFLMDFERDSYDKY